MQSPVPHGEQPITHQKELEARIQALEAMVGALLRFSAGRQDLANALKEARQRSEMFLRDPVNNVPVDYATFYRDCLHTLAVSMVPLEEMETFRASLQSLSGAFDSDDVLSRDCFPS